MNRFAVVALLAGVVMAGAPLPVEAMSEGVSLQVGVGQTPRRSDTAALFIEAVGEGRRIGVSSWDMAPVAVLGAVEGRSGRYSSAVFLGGGGVRIQRQGQAWFIEEAVVAAAGRTPAISGAIEFMTSFGWSSGQWEIIARHVSNAGTAGPNRGETMLLMGYRF